MKNLLKKVKVKKVAESEFDEKTTRYVYFYEQEVDRLSGLEHEKLVRLKIDGECLVKIEAEKEYTFKLEYSKFKEQLYWRIVGVEK